MNRSALAWGASVMGLAVLFGAFGAHGLKESLDSVAQGQWHTAVEQQVHHGLALLLLAAMGDRLPAKQLRAVRYLFLLGIVLFSGSIYLLSTRTLTGLDAASGWLGPITPVGGLCFVAGWVLLLITALRFKPTS